MSRFYDPFIAHVSADGKVTDCGRRVKHNGEPRFARFSCLACTRALLKESNATAEQLRLIRGVANGEWKWES